MDGENDDTAYKQELTEIEEDSSPTYAAASDNCCEQVNLPIYSTPSADSDLLNESTDDDSMPTVTEVQSEEHTPEIVETFYDAYGEEQTSEQNIIDSTTMGSLIEKFQDTSIIEDDPKSEQLDASNRETDDLDTDSVHIMNSEDKTAVVSHLFPCCQCSDNGIIVQATVSCSNCLELYCQECSDDHQLFKATQSHLLNQHSDLQKKETCEPCAKKGIRSKQPTHLCIECNEAQCDECRAKHYKLRLTRNHTLVPCISTPAEVMPKQKDNLEQGSSVVHCASTHEDVISESNYSSKKADVTLEKDTNKSKRPGKPCVKSTTVDNVVITWEQPEELFKNHSFQLRYKERDATKWVIYKETPMQQTLILHNLKSGAQFVFQVRMINDENDGPYSEQSDPIDTMRSAAEHLLEFTYDVEKPDTGMQLKKLPLHENRKARNGVGKTRKLELGCDKGVCVREKTILLVGATGTGKSTLVDGMINYVLGVKWDDPYRLTLVDLEEDERIRNVDQAESQTQWITCYKINPVSGGRLDYKLNIIDTPGFGDTSGIERDKQIIQQIKTLFSKEDDAGVLFIDAICFIIKAPDARLTPTQMYIFNAIMSLFGQDIKDNFSMLITFADGKQPPVLSALKKAKLPHDEYFPFNNSGLYAANSSSNESNFASMFWNMGCHSFEKFFQRLAKMETKSLIQTRDVLTQREQVEMKMENLTPLVDAGLIKVEEIRIEIDILNNYKTEIEANSDFKYSVNETQQTQVDLPRGQHVTNCLNCHFTCHKDCKIPNDEDKKKCKAMDKKGFCKQCPDNCKWDIHRNTPYIFEFITVPKEKTYAEKLEKYRRATDKKMTREKVVQRMHEEMSDLEDEIFDLLEEINVCNNTLRKIALRPDPLGLVEHIDLLIESEKLEKRPGFQKRILSLQRCRRQATIDDDIQRMKASFTESTSKITAQVHLPTRQKKKNRRNRVLSYFQPWQYFKKK